MVLECCNNPHIPLIIRKLYFTSSTETLPAQILSFDNYVAFLLRDLFQYRCKHCMLRMVPNCIYQELQIILFIPYTDRDQCIARIATIKSTSLHKTDQPMLYQIHRVGGYSL